MAENRFFSNADLAEYETRIIGACSEGVKIVSNKIDDTETRMIGAYGEGVKIVRKDINTLGDRLGEKRLKTWFWPLAAVVFAVVAFAMYYFTQNIAYITTLDANMNPQQVWNPARWIIVFSVPIVAAILMAFIPGCWEPKDRQ